MSALVGRRRIENTSAAWMPPIMTATGRISFAESWTFDCGQGTRGTSVAPACGGLAGRRDCMRRRGWVIKQLIALLSLRGNELTDPPMRA
jgi:hypothetical protein